MTFKLFLLATLIATLFVAGLASPLAVASDYELEESSDFPEYNETLASKEYHQLVTRGTTINCPGGGVAQAEVVGFRTFIDKIPNTQYKLGDPLKRIIFYTKFKNKFMLAELHRTKGTVASGKAIRNMLHDGFAACVLSGKQVHKYDKNVFFNFYVENPGYYLRVGGGFFNCRGLNGEGPGACKEVRIPSWDP